MFSSTLSNFKASFSSKHRAGKVNKKNAKTQEINYSVSDQYEFIILTYFEIIIILITLIILIT